MKYYINAKPKNESDTWVSYKEFDFFLVFMRIITGKEKVTRKDFSRHEQGNSFKVIRLKSYRNLTCCRRIVQKSLLQTYIHKRKTSTINNMSLSKEICHKKYFIVERKSWYDNQFNKYKKFAYRILQMAKACSGVFFFERTKKQIRIKNFKWTLLSWEAFQ